MSVALSCRGLSKRLGSRLVLRGLDLDVAAGEVVTLLGASGSGKTTLLRLVAGLLDPDIGSIRIGDATVWGTAIRIPPERRQVAMVFQDYALWPHMTVAGNIDFGLNARRLAAKEIAARVAHALEVTQLGAFAMRYPSELSGGQQQRVAIARCLAARPRLMLFDEPLSNLDAALREDLRTEMIGLVRAEGITSLYVTHDQAEAMAVSDRIAVMREGAIAQLDTPRTIYRAPADAFVASFLGGFSLLPGAASGGVFRPIGAEAPAIATTSPLEGKASLVIRPEDVRPAHGFAANRLTARVLSCAFQGRCWRLLVAVGEAKVRLDWPDGPDIGSELIFSLAPEDCTLVAR